MPLPGIFAAIGKAGKVIGKGAAKIAKAMAKMFKGLAKRIKTLKLRADKLPPGPAKDRLLQRIARLTKRLGNRQAKYGGRSWLRHTLEGLWQTSKDKVGQQLNIEAGNRIEQGLGGILDKLGLRWPGDRQRQQQNLILILIAVILAAVIFKK